MRDYLETHRASLTILAVFVIGLIGLVVLAFAHHIDPLSVIIALASFYLGWQYFYTKDHEEYEEVDDKGQPIPQPTIDEVLGR